MEDINIKELEIGQGVKLDTGDIIYRVISGYIIINDDSMTIVPVEHFGYNTVKGRYLGVVKMMRYFKQL